MSYRKVSLAPEEYFHVYNRGNSKQKIFLDDKDKDRFVKLLYLCNSTGCVNFRDDIIKSKIDAFDFERGETLVSIGAWVLMPNHFHLYITSSPKPCLGLKKDDDDQTPISIFLHKLCTSYVKYFNKKYDRKGSLFEDKFKSVHVENDSQAKYLFSYIHLNPVNLIRPSWKEKGIEDFEEALSFLDKYHWSSYHDHRGTLRKENKILDLNNFPEYFSNKIDFDSEIISWIYEDKNFPALSKA